MLARGISIVGSPTISSAQMAIFVAGEEQRGIPRSPAFSDVDGSRDGRAEQLSRDHRCPLEVVLALQMRMLVGEARRA